MARVCKKQVKRQAFAMLVALPFLAAFMLFFIVPFVIGVKQSFSDVDGNIVWFNNYKNILANEELIYKADFLRGLKNTLTFVGMAVPTMIIVPLVIALLIDIQPKGYKVFRAILFMPTVFSISSIVLMWKRVLQPETGFINSVLKALGLNQIHFLTDQPWAWISILIVTLWWTMGTNIVILGAGLKNIDRTVYEAASIDGASYFRTVFFVTLPLLTGQLLVVGIMTILASFNIYGQPLLLTTGGPDRSTQVLLMIIVSTMRKRPNIASAMSLLLGGIMIAVSLLQALIMKLRER